MGYGVQQDFYVENDAGVATDPNIAIDSSGNAIAVWSKDNGGSEDILANRFE